MPNPLIVHRGYQIHTWAVPLPSRKWKAEAMVNPESGLGAVEKVEVGLPNEFASESAATAHAEAKAVEHVDKKLGAYRARTSLRPGPDLIK